jgi:hypothetical protein
MLSVFFTKVVLLCPYDKRGKTLTGHAYLFYSKLEQCHTTATMASTKVTWEKLVKQSSDKVLVEVKLSNQRCYRYSCLSCNAVYYSRKTYQDHQHVDVTRVKGIYCSFVYKIMTYNKIGTSISKGDY